MSSLHYSELCRLCLVNERVSIPIFDGESGIQSLCLKIGTCLPIKISPEDILPKNICNDCFYKVENQYQFWISTANAEKQLLQWFSNSAPMPEVDKSLAAMAADQNNFKSEMDLDPSSELSKSLSQVEAVLAGETSNVPEKEEEEDEEEDESDEVGSNSEESDDDGDNAADDGAKDEGDTDEAYDEELEPTTFVNVSFECDEAGPSGTQQQQKQRAPPAPSTSTSAPAPSGVLRDSLFDDEVDEMFMKRDPLKPNKRVKQQKPFAQPKHRAKTRSSETLHKCTHPGCDITFKSQYHFYVHIETHVGNKPVGNIPCDACRLVFACQTSLDTHKKLVHTKHECSLCRKVFVDRSHLDRHKVVHSSERPFTCDACPKSFKRKCGLLVHKRNVHLGVKNLHCSECIYATNSMTNLYDHMDRHHSKTMNYVCDICGKPYSTEVSLKNHKVTHMEKAFKCDTCGKCFHRKSALAVHKQTHDPNRPKSTYSCQCETCGKKYGCKSALTRHLASHTGQARYTCEICFKVVTSINSLRIHNRRHTGEKPFACDVCGKAFVARNYLRTHKLIHTGVKPHKCRECDKAFTQRSTLVVHMRHHSGLRPYACEICSKTFISRALLTGHEKSHSLSSSY